MSKFDEIYNKLQENMPTTPTSTVVGQQNNNTNQQNQNNADPVEDLANQFAKINDPVKIKQMLMNLMQPQQKPNTGMQTSVPASNTQQPK